MATSDTRTYSYTRNDYIKAALRKSKVVSRFEAPEPEDISEGAEALNLYLASVSTRSDGAPNGKCWLRKNGALILDRAKYRYQLGGTDTDLVVPLEDLVIRDISNVASLTAGTSELQAIINEDFTVDHNAAIHYDDAGIFTSAISSYSAAGNLLDEPDFDNVGDWVEGTGWVIGSNVAACDGTQPAVSNLSQPTVIEDGTRYLVLTNVSAYTSGSLTPVLGSTRGSAIQETGWNLQFITASGTTALWEASFSTDFIGSVTSVVVIPVTGVLTMTMTNAFNRPCTSATEVYFYTETISKPLNIVTMSWRNRTSSNEDDMPMTRFNEQQYEALPDKDVDGDPSAYYYEEKLDHGLLYLDTRSDDIRNTVIFKYTPQVQYFTASTDELDIPDVGREMIVYNLAKRLAGEHGKVWSQENEMIRLEASAAFMRDNEEVSRTFFEPDRVRFGDGAGGEFT